MARPALDYVRLDPAIRSLRALGMSIAQIARRLAISERSVHYALRRIESISDRMAA